MLPTLFLSHGSPDLILRNTPATAFFTQFGRELSTPDLIVVISAHWLTEQPRITGAGPLETIHDFYGFPDALYQQRYAAEGDEHSVQAVLNCLRQQGIDAEIDAKRGLDHGAWVPLKLMYPQAPCPIVQVSLPLTMSIDQTLQLGQALAPLRQQSALIVGTGSATHNLRDIKPGDQPDDWARDVDTWLCERIEQGDSTAVCDPQRWHPQMPHAHPTIEHLIPLHAAWAAAGLEQAGRLLHNSFDFSNLSMSSYAF